MPIEDPPQQRHNRSRLWSLGAYFLLLSLFAGLNLELFKELAKSNYVSGFSKLSELISSSFDVYRLWDDITVTLYSLFLTFVFVIPVGWVYVLTKDEDEIDPSLVQTVIVLGLVVCGVMMMLQDSLARAFGLVGVVAAVRFRSTLKDAKDAVYIFLAIGVAMGCGLKVYHIAILLSVVLNGVFLLLWSFRIGKGSRPAAGKPGIERVRSGETRTRLEGEAGMQARLLTLAESIVDKGKGIKRPNAALLVEVDPSGDTLQLVRKVLDEQEQWWFLVSIQSKNTTTMLEFLGRVDKDEPLPLKVVEELRTQCQPHVRGVELRTLRETKGSSAARQRMQRVEP